MKTFTYIPSPTLPLLSVKESNRGRVYVSPSGSSWYSVTTILGHFGKEHIAEWQERVGIEEANRITVRASYRGDRYHALCEAYLKNEKNIERGFMPNIVQSFRETRPTLDRIDNIRYIECALYSDSLRTAGRCDLVAEFDGVLSIIDHKTSLKIKKVEWITNYFEQKTAYAIMLEELTDIRVTQLVTLISVDNEPEPQIFITNRIDYEDSLRSKIDAFYKDMTCT